MTYKIKDVTLDERLDITDLYREGQSELRTNANTLRKTLIELKGIEITKENIDQEINKLSTAEINEYGYEIAKKINHFQDKKK